jgi:serine/threonine protein kinase
VARWLGKYELLRPIGKGGMAELHLARVAGGMPGAHKLVVVKQMLPLLAEDASFVEMFVDEARLALALDHPNVVHVFDVGSCEGRYFFAMEYLHGEDVAHISAAARAQARTLPLAEALAVGIGVAAGLHYAHEKRGVDGAPLEIVHRDVSPQNVLVTFDGAVKLLDFGIAKAAHRLTETRHGTIKGKVRYMAPEQIRSESLDRRADVFALGVLVWELTTGRPLYDGTNEYALQQQIVGQDARRPSVVVPDYPPELERIVLKAVSRQREERFASAELFQLALEEFARERKLAVSSVGLARFLRDLFAEKAAAWRQAQSAGDEAVTELVLADLAERPAVAGADAGASWREPASQPSRPSTRPLSARPGTAATVAESPLAVEPVVARSSLSRISTRGRRAAIRASLATAIVATAGVLLAQPYFAPPSELPPPQRIVTAARVDLPVRLELPPVHAHPPPRALAQLGNHSVASHRRHPHAATAPRKSRWDADAALPPP